jgi:adenylate cyclase class 2
MRPEVEVKVACKDLNELEERLMKQGAMVVGEVLQEDVYFAHPCRDFGTSDEALRIRRSGEEWRLTYKGPKLDRETKTREELEIVVDPVVRTILEKLGFEEVMSIHKRRKILTLEEIEVSLDRVEGLGDFVELEYKGESVENGKRSVFQAMERLGLEGSERRSYLELLLRIKNRKD